MQTTNSKLIKVIAILLPGKHPRYRYVGYFENGLQLKIRESFNVYVSVAQLTEGDFVFSSKPSAPLSARQQARLISHARVHADCSL
jgi:hypothetical protein